MNEEVKALMGKKDYDLTQITRLLLEMRDNCNPQKGIAYDDPKRREKYDALNAAIDLINNPSMVVNGNTNDEVMKIVDALRYGDIVQMFDYFEDAADLIEKLAAENERLQARCEAAEKDIRALATEEANGCDVCKNDWNFCPGTNCYNCEHFEWSGPQDGGTANG